MKTSNVKNPTRRPDSYVIPFFNTAFDLERQRLENYSDLKCLLCFQYSRTFNIRVYYPRHECEKRNPRRYGQCGMIFSTKEESQEYDAACHSTDLISTRM